MEKGFKLDARLPRRGTTTDQYPVSEEWRRAAKIINLFDRRKKIKVLAAEGLARVVNG
jgi:hypothetical protein